MSSGLDTTPAYNLVAGQASALCTSLRMLQEEKGKLVGGKVIWACNRVSEDLAKLTKTLVNLDFTINEIRAREQAVLPVMKRKHAESSDSDSSSSSEDEPKPKAKRASPSFGPAMTAGVR